MDAVFIGNIGTKDITTIKRCCIKQNAHDSEVKMLSIEYEL